MQNWNKKRGENVLFCRLHSKVDRDLQKKKVFTLFSDQRVARRFNGFSKSGPSCKKLAHPRPRIINNLTFMTASRTATEVESDARLVYNFLHIRAITWAGITSQKRFKILNIPVMAEKDQ